MSFQLFNSQPTQEGRSHGKAAAFTNVSVEDAFRSTALKFDDPEDASNYLTSVAKTLARSIGSTWASVYEVAFDVKETEAWRTLRPKVGEPPTSFDDWWSRIFDKPIAEFVLLERRYQLLKEHNPQVWFDLGDDPEALAEAIGRQFTVEQRRQLVKALQSPDLRVSRQEADRLRKRALRGTDLAARACDHCGVVFEPKRSQARFCGGSCRAKASQVRKEPAVTDPAVVEAPPEREVPKGPARQRYGSGREGLELLEGDLEIYGQERLCELLGVKASTLKGYYGRLKAIKDWEPAIEGPKRRSQNLAAAAVEPGVVVRTKAPSP